MHSMLEALCQSLINCLLSHTVHTLSPAQNFKAVSSFYSPYTQAGLPSVCCIVVGARGEMLILSMTSRPTACRYGQPSSVATLISRANLLHPRRLLATHVAASPIGSCPAPTHLPGGDLGVGALPPSDRSSSAILILWNPISSLQAMMFCTRSVASPSLKPGRRT